MNKKLMFVGGGAMAEAILTGLKKSGKDLKNVSVFDPNPRRLAELESLLGISPVPNTPIGIQTADIVIIAVKPQVLPNVLPEIASAVKQSAVVVSIAAGVTLKVLEKALPEEQKVIRVMPNTPLMVGEGMSGLCKGTFVSEEDLAVVEEIFSASGKTLIVKENLIDALSGISGCGPAFMYLFIEALMDAGVLNGLTRKEACLLAAQTMLGSARMVLETGEEPAKLKGQVTSPGGTTIAGIKELEKAALRGAVMDAVTATIQRSKELENG
jgi:pyrroline-5-carboxylate reductase